MDESQAKRIVAAVADHAQEFGVGVLSECEKDILIPWWAHGVVSNGGFEYLYQCEHDIPQVVRRLRAVGLDAVAATYEQVSTAILRSGVVPVEDGARAIWAAGVDWDQFAAQETAIYAVAFPAVLAAIGEYIERNRGAFSRAIGWAAEEAPEQTPH